MSEPASPSPVEKPQFSLRALLGVVTLACVVSAVVAQAGQLAIPLLVIGGAFALSIYWYVIGWRTAAECFALISILTVLGIWLIPFPVTERTPGCADMCSNNLKQIGIGLQLYHGKHNSFPARNRTLPDDSPGVSWRVAILPYIEQQNLYDEFHLDEPWDSRHNLSLANSHPDLYACPSARGPSKIVTNYAAIGGVNGCWPNGKPIATQDITDGTSNTLLVVESHSFNAAWSEPRDLDPATMSWSINQKVGISSGHPGGAQVLWADTSVRFLTEKVDPQVLRELANRHDGKPAPGWDE